MTNLSSRYHIASFLRAGKRSESSLQVGRMAKPPFRVLPTCLSSTHLGSQTLTHRHTDQRQQKFTRFLPAHRLATAAVLSLGFPVVTLIPPDFRKHQRSLPPSSLSATVFTVCDNESTDESSHLGPSASKMPLPMRCPFSSLSSFLHTRFGSLVFLSVKGHVSLSESPSPVRADSCPLLLLQDLAS